MSLGVIPLSWADSVNVCGMLSVIYCNTINSVESGRESKFACICLFLSKEVIALCLFFKGL